MTNKTTAKQFSDAFEMGAVAYGPLWDCADNVMHCLRRYVTAEGHARFAAGKSVYWLASVFMAHPFLPDRDELRAVHRLLELDCGGAIV